MSGKTGPQLDAALRRAMLVFWHHGFSATSMREVVADLGMSSKSLYAEFGGKEALFLAAIELYAVENERRYRSELAREPLGIANIERFFSSSRFDDSFEGCLFVNTLAEHSSVPRAAIRRIDTFFALVADLYEANLSAARGEVAGSTNTAALARALLVFDQGLAAAGSSRGQRKHLEGATRAMLQLVREPGISRR